MEKYKNLGGRSGVSDYKIFPDMILVRFSNNGCIYCYSYDRAGKENVEKMKELAQAGQGLGTFINNNVYFLYDYRVTPNTNFAGRTKTTGTEWVDHRNGFTSSNGDTRSGNIDAGRPQKADPEAAEAAARRYSEEISLAKIDRCIKAVPGDERLKQMRLFVVNLYRRIEDRENPSVDAARFVDEFLPKMMNIIDTYATLSENREINGPDENRVLNEIEGSLDEMIGALKKVYNKSYSQKVMDASTDLAALKGLFANEGLIEDEGPFKADL